MMMRTNQRSLKSVLTAAGHGEVPIWITEFGAPTYGTDTQASDEVMDEAGQAESLSVAFDLMASNTLLDRVMWYEWYDRNTGASATESNDGVVRSTKATPKPAVAAFQAIRH